MLAYIFLCYQAFISLAVFLDILIGTAVSLIVLGIRERQSDTTEMVWVFFL